MGRISDRRYNECCQLTPHWSSDQTIHPQHTGDDQHKDDRYTGTDGIKRPYWQAQTNDKYLAVIEYIGTPCGTILKNKGNEKGREVQTIKKKEW